MSDQKRAHSSGKSGPAFDAAEQDAQRDLEHLRRQEVTWWRSLAERKYPRFRSTPIEARTANPDKGQDSDE